MEKYRLIKNYPSTGLEVGDIVEWTTNICLPQYFCKVKDIGVYGTDVSKFPEYWEKVEVIFTTEDGVGIEEGQAVYCVFTDENLSQYMYPEPFQYNNLTPEFKNEHKIFSTEKVAKDYCEARKPKPLLITEEGVEVFKGGTIYYVKPDYSFGWEGVVDAKCFKKQETGWYFSTKEAAEIFINKHKVIEKEYEILSFSKPDDKILKIKGEDGLFHWCYTSLKDTEKSLIERKFNIHSVKRMSDGVIFSVGDRVDERLSDKKNMIIKSFKIHFNKLCIYGEKGCLNTQLLLEFLDKHTPLLKTVDGVDIFEGDKVWYYDSMYRIWDSKADTKIHNKRNTAFTYFSTKEAAKNYSKERKPFFITEDNVEIKENQTVFCLFARDNYRSIHPLKFYKSYLELLDLKKAYKFFSTEEAAEKFHKENKHLLFTNNQTAKNLVVDLIDKSKSLENAEKDYFKHVIKNKI